jgi:hypothetical protein
MLSKETMLMPEMNQDFFQQSFCKFSLVSLSSVHGFDIMPKVKQQINGKLLINAN